MEFNDLNFPEFVANDNPLCAETDPEMFYAEEIVDASNSSKIRAVYRHEREAKAVCRKCPLQEPCLRFALENREMGIWGGTTESDRKNIRRVLTRD